jgi:hypothetical protein
MSGSGYKYDVAFSFAGEDEAIANALDTRIRDRLVTFLYSERQKELGGTDGIESFSRAFRLESRLVVIIYSDKWSKNRWTKIEESAIKERFLEGGEGADPCRSQA